MWIQTNNPLNNQALSTLLALVPILFLFYALAVRRLKGITATSLTLLVALVVTIFGYNMPAKLAFASVLDGMANGLFPIGWIVLAAVFLYNLSIKSGSFAIVRESIEAITEDRRLQALLIAFCFGAFLEGAAGFGAPVAITAGILVGLGFQPLYAAAICLIANTAPVAFGGIGIAIITAGQVAGIDPNLISRTVVHQLPYLAFMLPFWLTVIIAGWRGTREIWPAVFITGLSYSVTMYLTATYIGPSLPDILSSLVSMICLVGFLRIWKPKKIWRFPGEQPLSQYGQTVHYSATQLLYAWAPFLLLVILVGNWATTDLKAVFDRYAGHYAVPVLNKAIEVAGKPLGVTYAFPWLSAAGTAILVAAVLSGIFLRISARDWLQTFKETAKELRAPLVTIACVVGFAYLANYSGITATLGKALTVTGAAFPLLSPVLGWIGVFLTGSDTSSNALFANVQRVTATQIGVNPVLTVAANTTGGVTAKMISPQNIAVATAATGLTGKEGQLFRKTLPHSLAFLLFLSVLTFVQARYFTASIPKISGVVTATAAAGWSVGETALLSVSGLIIVIMGLWLLQAPVAHYKARHQLKRVQEG